MTPEEPHPHQGPPHQLRPLPLRAVGWLLGSHPRDPEPPGQVAQAPRLKVVALLSPALSPSSCAVPCPPTFLLGARPHSCHWTPCLAELPPWWTLSRQPKVSLPSPRYSGTPSPTDSHTETTKLLDCTPDPKGCGHPGSGVTPPWGVLRGAAAYQACSASPPSDWSSKAGQSPWVAPRQLPRGSVQKGLLFPASHLGLCSAACLTPQPCLWDCGTTNPLSCPLATLSRPAHQRNPITYSDAWHTVAPNRYEAGPEIHPRGLPGSTTAARPRTGQTASTSHHLIQITGLCHECSELGYWSQVKMTIRMETPSLLLHGYILL